MISCGRRDRRRGALSAALAGALVIGAGAAAAASYADLVAADARLDLETARRTALDVVAAAPTTADAVAAAAWWYTNLDLLPGPDAILAAAGRPRDPELELQLGRIAAAIEDGPPPGALAAVDLSGPFGVFDVLDLERGVVPGDEQLPPLPSPWTGPASIERHGLRSADGWVGPPESTARSGVFLAAWTLELGADFDGWLVVECRGSFNLELDGQPLDRRRQCGELDPAVSWYRVALAGGRHRVRAEIAARRVPRVRVTLIDVAGTALPQPRLVPSTEGPWASATAAAALPPAAAALEQQPLVPPPTAAAAVLAAALAEGRGDGRRQRYWLERGTAADDPLTALELGWYLLLDEPNLTSDEGARRAAELLPAAAAAPAAALLDRAIALRERRSEDAERILAELAEAHSDDVRIRRLWTREAIRRGWAREIEDGTAALTAALPESETILELRLDALEALDRWDDRRRLLQATAEGRFEPDRLDELAGSCLANVALAAVERQRQRADDPALDLAAIKMLLENGRTADALAALEEAQDRWGPLPPIDELRLVATADDPVAFAAALDDALEHTPTNVQLRTLAWRRGQQPFFAPWRIDAATLLAERPAPAAGVDSVLLLDQAVERIYPDGSSLYYYHGLTEAITPVGARQAAGLQQLSKSYLLAVRIHKPDGRVVAPVDLAGRGDGTTLADVEPGDVVEEEYVAYVAATGTSRRGHLPPYVYRFADDQRAFGRSEYLLLVPPGIELQIDGTLSGLEKIDQEHDGLRLIGWRARDVPPITREPFAPPAQELLPWVSYGFGVSWQDVGDAVRDRVLPLLHPSEELAAWSASRLAEGDEPQAEVRALVNGLIDDVERDRTDLDLSEAAATSFGVRHGNRLLIAAAALLANDWQVDLVLARPRPFAGTHLEVPTMEPFSSPLLRVRRGDVVIWLDLDEERRGIDHVAPILQGSDALVLPLADATQPVTLLAEIPSFANPDLEEIVSVRASVDASGSATIDFVTDIHGGQAERMLDSIESATSDRANLVYQQLAANLFPGAGNVRGALDRIDGGARLDLELDLRGACDPAADQMTCRSLVLAQPLAPALASLPERRYPLVLALGFAQQLTLELVAPPGWTIDRQPRRLTSRWGTVDETLTRDGAAIRSVLAITIPPQTVDPADYPEFARFCHAVDELASRPPVLTPSHPPKLRSEE